MFFFSCTLLFCVPSFYVNSRSCVDRFTAVSDVNTESYRSPYQHGGSPPDFIDALVREMLGSPNDLAKRSVANGGQPAPTSDYSCERFDPLHINQEMILISAL